MRCLFLLPVLCCLACGSSSSSGGAAGGNTGFGGISSGGGSSGSGGSGGSAGGVLDAGNDAHVETDAAPVDKAALCTDTFGDQLTDSFGRVDGTVLAIVAPDDTQCPLVNNDHLVIQITMNGAVYRMVVNLDVHFAELDVPQLAGGAWQEGWHPNALLDYVSMLKLSSGDFTQYSMNEVVQKVSDQIEIGKPISVFATSSGGTYASSAHLVHRNGQNHDGAIVTNPTGTNFHYLTFRFDDQSF